MGNSVLRTRIINRQLIYWLVFLAILLIALALVSTAAAFLPTTMKISLLAIVALVASYYFVSSISESPQHRFVRSVDKLLNPLFKASRKALDRV